MKEMTTGEKLIKLRKENGYTQEELADILGVSRQAVSKWESGAAYPETEKLIKLGKLYNCSMDYLLNDSRQQEDGDSQNSEKRITFSFDFTSKYFERKSKIMVGKIPLWHINIGLGRTATGVFAFGLSARGVFSFGLLSIGVFSFGMLSIGALALGMAALGLMSFGAFSFGLIAFGAIAIGLLSVGAIAVGEYAVGALAAGQFFALGDHAYGAIAIGKTVAEGSAFSAPYITDGNRAEVIRLLNEHTPAILGWIKAIIISFI